MKLSIWFLFIFLSHHSFAQTPFDTLKERFYRGADIKFGDIKGNIYSGRCYNKGNQTNPLASNLGLLERNSNSVMTEKMVAGQMGSKYGFQADSYKKAQAEKVLGYIENQFPGITYENGTMSSFVDGLSESTMKLRKSNRYLILIYFAGVDTEGELLEAGMTKISKGEVWEVCYYDNLLPN